MKAFSSIMTFMNNFFEKSLAFLYFKNRIITTIGLMVGILNPFIGLAIVGVTYFNAINRQKMGLGNVRKEDRLFMLISLILLGVTAVLNLILVIRSVNTPDPSISETLLNLL